MTDLSTITIRVTDVRKAGICMNGARDFFARHGLSLHEFLASGISAQTLWDTGDGYAQMVVKRKLEREGILDG